MDGREVVVRVVSPTHLSPNSNLPSKSMLSCRRPCPTGRRPPFAPSPVAHAPPIRRHTNMGPLFHRSSMLFTPREFISAVRLRRPQLPRLVCRQCQFVLWRQPYSIGNDSSKIPRADGGDKVAEDVKGSPETTTATPAPPSPTWIDVTKLPSTIEDRRMEISRKFSKAMNDLQGAFFVAGKRLNEVTGYAGIEQMKKAIEAQGTPSLTLCFVAPLYDIRSNSNNVSSTQLLRESRQGITCCRPCCKRSIPASHQPPVCVPT